MDSVFKGAKKRNFKVMLLASIVVLALVFTTGYFYVQYQKIKKNPEIVSKQETDALVKQVGKLIDIPKDETPTVATVEDKDKLKDQPFFANAENGDKILIYTKAKKAIIFRQKENRLINVGPIAIDQTASNTTPVAIVNAGGDSDKVEKTINNNLSDSFSVISKSDAKSNKNVDSTVVVDLSGNSGDAANKLAQAIGGTVGSLPQGEDQPAGASIAIFVK
jgi:hypothetical protein